MVELRSDGGMSVYVPDGTSLERLNELAEKMVTFEHKQEILKKIKEL